MMNIKNIAALAANTAKIIVAFAGAVAVAEATVMGANGAVNDARAVKETINPTPIKVKNPGVFGKTKNVTVNPFTGKAKEYNGNKQAVNKKPVKLSKAI